VHLRKIAVPARHPAVDPGLTQAGQPALQVLPLRAGGVVHPHPLAAGQADLAGWHAQVAVGREDLARGGQVLVQRRQGLDRR
jgi:hypothetical protein